MPYRLINWRHYLVSSRFSNVLYLNKEMQNLRISQVPDLHYRDTVKLAYKEFNGKYTIDNSITPLVLIHGLFGSKQNFGSVGRQICKLTKRLVVGLDMRNHGSSPNAMPHDYIHMAKDIIRHIEGMNRKVVLAGHLMGAKASMLVSLLRPDLVEKLVVIDHSPTNEPLDFLFTQDLLGLCHIVSNDSLRNLPRSILYQRVDKILSAFEKDPLVRLFLTSNIRRTQCNVNEWQEIKCCVPVLNFLKMGTMVEMEKWPDLVRGLRYDGPVKIIRGKKSLFVLDRHLEIDFPKYFPVILAIDFDTGHWVVSERPTRFVQEIIDFIKT